MAKKKDEDFPKRNELATLKGNNLSVYAHKTFDYIYKAGLKYYEDKRDGGIFTLNVYDLKEAIGMTGSDHSVIVKELEAIRKVDFECYDTKYYSKFPLLAGFELKSNGVLEVALSPFLIRMIFDEKSPYYHMSNILDYKELRSKYSKRILDLVKRYKYKIPKMSMEKFHDLMQYSEKYRTNDIKIKVLEQAQKELKEYNELELTWEFEKQRTKIIAIKLTVEDIAKKKKKDNDFDNAEEAEVITRSEKLQKAIDKARKNIHIDAKYSEKFMQRLIDNYEEKDIIKALSLAYTYNSEIKTFYGFMKATIEDIIDSKKKTPEPKPSVPETVVSDTDASDVAAAEVTEKIKITQAEYEELYKAHLKEKNGEDSMFTRKFFDSLNMKKYEIIEEVPAATDADDPLGEPMITYINAPESLVREPDTRLFCGGKPTITREELMKEFERRQAEEEKKREELMNQVFERAKELAKKEGIAIREALEKAAEQMLEEDTDEELVVQEPAGTKIEELDFTVRTFNVLKKAGIQTVEHLKSMSREEVKKIRNLGKKSFEEIEEALGNL